jgi:hypothetical protein
MAILPVYALLSIMWALNIYFGVAVSLIVFIYFLWLLNNGMVYSLKCRKNITRIVSYVLTGLIILFLLLNLRAYGSQHVIKNDVKNTKELKK